MNKKTKLVSINKLFLYSGFLILMLYITFVVCLKSISVNKNQFNKLIDGTNEVCILNDLPYGVYVIDINYSTEYSNGSLPGSKVYVTGDIDTSNIILSDSAYLYDYKNNEKLQLWVKALKGSGKITINIDKDDNCITNISSICVKTHPLWKIREVLVFSALLLCIILGTRKWNGIENNQKIKCIIATAIIIFASYPALIGDKGVFFGHDLEFHINRIASIANEIIRGNFPVYYQHDAQNGAGYIALLMYGDFFLSFPVGLYVLGYPLSVCYNAYIIFINIITYIVVNYSLKNLFKKNKYALFGTIIYMLFPYRLTDLYIRGALGEYTAITFLPLAIYGIYRIYYEDYPLIKKCLPLILAMSGILESHVVTVEMFTLFAIIFAIVHFRETFKQIIPLLFSVVSVFILNLFFLLPLIGQYRQELCVNTSHIPTSDLSTTGIFIPQLFGLFMTHSGAGHFDSCYNEMPMCVGAGVIVCLLIYLIILIANKDLPLTIKNSVGHKLVFECFIYLIICMWLTTYLFPWKEFHGNTNIICRMMTVIQFSWRYLAFVGLFSTIIAVYVFYCIDKSNVNFISKIDSNIIAFGIVILTVLVIGEFYAGFMDNTELMKYNYIGSSTQSDWIYLPYDLDSNEIKTRVESDSQVVVKNNGIMPNGERCFYIKNSGETCEINLPIIFYNYLKLYNGKNEQIAAFSGANSQLSFVCDGGFEDSILVKYVPGKGWIEAYFISSFYAIILLIYYLRSNWIEKNKRYI